jgi:hypothetical protein
MRRTYTIRPRPANLGGGWNLKLYEDGQEAGGGVYPVQAADPRAGIDAERNAHLLADAYNDAMGDGESWSA